MTKKKPVPVYKQFWFPWVAGAVIVPTLGLIWANFGKVWSAPEKIENIEQAVVQQANISKDLKEIVLEQKTKNELQDVELAHQKEMNASQLDALKAIVFEVKKKK